MSNGAPNLWLWGGLGAMILAASLALPDAARAQQQPERVSFRASSECSSPESVEMLREAIAVRLGGQAELVGDPRPYSVSWAPGSAGCRLLVETPSTTTPVSLGSESDPDAIRNAASRAVWLLANAEPREPEVSGTNSPGDEASREAPADDSEGDTLEGSAATTEEALDPASEQQGSDEAATDKENTDSETVAMAPTPPKPDEVEEPAAPEPEPPEEGSEEDVSEDASETQPDESTEPPEPETSESPREPKVPEDELGPDYNEVGVRVSILPGVGIPMGRGPYVTKVAFNIIGYQAGVRELEMGLIANINSDFVEGTQFSGIANISGGRMDGLAISGGVNITAQEHVGQQISSSFNFANRLDGAQISPVNLTIQPMKGAQIGMFNLAGDASGVQLGMFNLGKRVKGVQFGLVNFAADSDYSIGLLNINYRLPLYVELWATELGANFIGLRHGSRYIQGIVATGFRPSTSASRAMWSMGLGLGVHVPLGEKEQFFLETDVIDYLIIAPDPASFDSAVGNHLQFRLNLGWQIAKRFALFGGASLNLLFSDNTQSDAVTFSGPLVFESGVDSSLTALWPGFQAGVRF